MKIVVLYYSSPLDKFPSLSFNVQGVHLAKLKNVKLPCALSVGQSRLIINFCYYLMAHVRRQIRAFRITPFAGHKNNHLYSFCRVIQSCKFRIDFCSPQCAIARGYWILRLNQNEILSSFTCIVFPISRFS